MARCLDADSLHSSRFIVLKLCAAVLTTLFASPIRRAEAQSIWLAPKAPYPPAQIAGSPDLMNMFQPDAPWNTVSAHVKVFKLPTQFLAWVPSDQLTIILDDLKRRGIKLAVESLAQSVLNQPACGQGVEGYGVPEQAEKIAAKVVAAGGTVSFVTMDEPLFFGHVFDGPTACHSSVQNVAERVAAIVGRYRAAFPEVVIGDIEPAGAPMIDGWNESFVDWIKAFRITVGTPLGFLQVDADWNNPNHVEGLIRSMKLARDNGLRTGVIYNGRDNDGSNEEWIAHARANIRAVETTLGRVPDDVIFQTWTPYPSMIMPETNKNSLTGLVYYYLHSYAAGQ